MPNPVVCPSPPIYTVIIARSLSARRYNDAHEIPTEEKICPKAKCRHFHTCGQSGSIPANGKPMRP
jgi:hypothetical protein